MSSAKCVYLLPPKRNGYKQTKSQRNGFIQLPLVWLVKVYVKEQDKKKKNTEK